MKITLAADTSSPILLYKTCLLEGLSSSISFLISSSVKSELMEKSFEIEKKIYLKSTILTQKCGQDHTADHSLFEIYNQFDCDAILSDDGGVLRKAKHKGFPHFCALSLLSKLFTKDLIQYEFAITKMAELEKIGRYSPFVVNFAYKML